MKKDLFILAGPTAVGKTQISIKLAKKLQGEIISADSMQIYKHMDIGSAKVKEEEKQGIPHYLIDIISPNEEFSVSEFTKRAKILIDEVSSKKKLPMIVGGTGLYINSLIFNYNFAETSRDENYRNYLNALAQKKGKEYVHNLLKEVDKESSEKLYPNDLKRVIRALEVYKVTGKTIGELNLEADIYEIPYNVHYYVLCMNREELYERINMRVDMMLQEGLLNEVKALMEMGLNSSMQSMKGIGYKELLEHLEGKISLEEAIYLIKKGSRNYAKRQLTWFRKDKRVNWIDKEQFANDDDIVNYIVKDFKEKKYKEIIVSN